MGVVMVWTEHVPSRRVGYAPSPWTHWNATSWFPILLDDVTPPVAFRTTQAADLRNWRPGSVDARFDQLMAQIDRRVPPALSRPPISRRPNRQSCDRDARVSTWHRWSARWGSLWFSAPPCILSFGGRPKDESEAVSAPMQRLSQASPTLPCCHSTMATDTGRPAVR